MTKTLVLPSGTKFRTATSRRYVLVIEGRERLTIDPTATVCPRCGGEVVSGFHRKSSESDVCHAMGASTGVEIVKRSDSIDVLRKARKSAGLVIVDTDSGEVVR